MLANSKPPDGLASARVQDQQRSAATFPVVGIGASAGGLDAFKQFLHALPADTGMAYVLVQHLNPTHPSVLAEILGRETSMPVHEVTENLRVEPNHVYVIGPGTSLEIVDHALRRMPRREGEGMHRPIDIFFRSLAAAQGHKSIGVVLSGSATDGTLGLQEIKAAGGITFAQDETAQHDSMPHSAVASGCVDFVLPPEAIAREIARIAHDPYVHRPAEEEAEKPWLDLTPVLDLLHAAKSIDFAQYKPNTLQRRIQRRMVLQRTKDLQKYLQMLKSTPAELDALYHDILINVTSFFRNPEAFDALKTKVFPVLLENRSRHDSLRVWVLGCSTGEEAYSIAIALSEFLETTGDDTPIQLFATDLNASYIDRARSGIYSRNIAQDVSPERLRRFFTEVEGTYHIKKSIRDVCVFAAHNILAAPPFSRIDLVSCRNLLIYLGTEMQQRVIPILHYALKPTGFLWLGSSETIGAYRGLFEISEPRHKIYRKKPTATRLPLAVARAPERTASSHARTGVTGSGHELLSFHADAYREADRLVIAKYAPPGVLVNGDFEILQFRGDTGLYLTPAPGKASFNLLKMLREGLLVGVRRALNKAKKEERSVREEGLRVRANGGDSEVSIEVVPIRTAMPRASCFMVLFDERAATDAHAGDAVAAVPGTSDTNRQDDEATRLQQELAATREYLQSVIEQQDAANEELQAANEEVQSSNEELQSVNEELETSKEEVQSSNEELVTVNEELHNRNVELVRTNNDLLNLLSSVEVAIIILDPGLRIRRFTPMAEKMLNVIPADVGRPIKDLNLNIDMPDLVQHLENVIATVSAKEFEVRDSAGHWYLLRLRPYRTLENQIDGALLVLVDVDPVKRGEETLRRQNELLEQVHEPIFMWDLDGGIFYWNKASSETYGYTWEEARGRSSHELLATSPPFSTFREALMANGRWSAEVLHTRRDGQKIMLESRMALVREAADRTIVVEANRPITEHKELECILRRRADDLVEADRHKDEFLAMLAHELRNPLAPLRNIVHVVRNSGQNRAVLEHGLQIMERQIQNMSRLLDDLLDVSRVTLGSIGLRKERVDVHALVSHAAELARSHTEPREQTLEVAVAETPMCVWADPVRIEQVLGNLLNNASKYTPRGGHIRLAAGLLAATGEDAAGGTIEIRVADNGDGIASDMLPRVFDLFMHAGRSLDAVHGGLGIGLTLVRRLVELHGGTISAASAGPGKGSEFVIRVPAYSEHDTTGEDGVPAPSATRQRVRRRILVVDDNIDAADSAAMGLRLHGHEVEVAYDGRSALDAARRFQPEVVLLDIAMPSVDGYEVARELRELPGLERITVIGLSGFGHNMARERATQAGFDHYLTKPAEPDVIEELLGIEK